MRNKQQIIQAVKKIIFDNLKPDTKNYDQIYKATDEIANYMLQAHITYVKNNKTGDIYTLLSTEIIDATNGHSNGREMVAYETKDGQIYIREKENFDEKFTVLTGDEYIKDIEEEFKDLNNTKSDLADDTQT